MTLDEVVSINQIWKAAKKGGLKCHNNVLRYVYRFESEELVDFTWELSVFIEDTPGFDEYYAKNFDKIIGCIKAEHSKGLTYHFKNSHI